MQRLIPMQLTTMRVYCMELLWVTECVLNIINWPSRVQYVRSMCDFNYVFALSSTIDRFWFFLFTKLLFSE